MTGLKTWKEREDRKLLNEAAKRILNKAKYKRRNSTRQLSQQLEAKAMLGGKTPSGGLWKAKVGDRWEGKRHLCPQPNSVQLDWNLLNSTKTSLRKNGMIFFFRTNVLNICFSCPQFKKWYCLGESQVPPAYQVKKVQNESHGTEWYIFYPKDRLWLPITTSTTY